MERPTVRIGALCIRLACVVLLGAFGAGGALGAVGGLERVSAASAAPDTASVRPDTTAVRPDTAAARPGGAPVPAEASAPADSAAAHAKPLWSMDELKGLLDAQAGAGATKAQCTKRGRVAMLCALLVPGLGQMYNERPLKAAIALGVETVYLSNILRHYRLAERMQKERDHYPPGSSQWRARDAWVNEYNARVTDWIWWSGGAVMIIMLDAYVDAHLADMRVSVEGAAVAGGGGVQVVVRF